MVSGVLLEVSRSGDWEEEAAKNVYVVYSYEVNGRTYTSNRYHLKEDSLSGIGSHVSGLRPHQRVDVYVKPGEPKTAVLNVQYIRDGFLFGIIILGFVVATATMLYKEKRWNRLTEDMVEALPDGYDGRTALPSSKLVRDKGGVLWLNTGMSVFWSFGAPFLVICFAGVGVLMLITDTLNPAMGLEDYLLAVCGVWAAGVAVGLAFTFGTAHEMEIHANDREVREHTRMFGPRKTRTAPFSEFVEVILKRDVWRPDNPLRNWLFYLHQKGNRSWHILHRHRDIQPSSFAYLDRVKRRVEHVVLGIRTRKGSDES